MSGVIIPKPGSIYSEYFAQGSDGNYYVKVNGLWQKAGTGGVNVTPFDPAVFVFPAAKKGDLFNVVDDGRVQDKQLEKGDLLICITDTEEGHPENFEIVQANVESRKDFIEETPLQQLKAFSGDISIRNSDASGLADVTVRQVKAEKVELKKEVIDLRLKDTLDFDVDFVDIEAAAYRANILRLYDLSNYRAKVIFIKNSTNIDIQLRNYQNEDIKTLLANSTYMIIWFGSFLAFNIEPLSA